MTWLWMKSFERRLEKLDGWITDIESGRISVEDLRSCQQRLDKEVRDTLDEKTADEEGTEDDREESEVTEDWTLAGVAAVSLEDLKVEQVQVQNLLDLALQVDEVAEESKFQKLREFLSNHKQDAIFLHPGEPVFDRFREYVCGNFAQAALQGGVFVDSNAEQPYLFHIALISVVRKLEMKRSR